MSRGLQVGPVRDVKLCLIRVVAGRGECCRCVLAVGWDARKLIEFDEQMRFVLFCHGFGAATRTDIAVLSERQVESGDVGDLGWIVGYVEITNDAATYAVNRSSD